MNYNELNFSTQNHNDLKTSCIEDNPRLIKLRNDVYSLPVDSEYKRALLEAICIFGKDVMNNPENIADQEFDDLEMIQQLALAKSVEDFFANADW